MADTSESRSTPTLRPSVAPYPDLPLETWMAVALGYLSAFFMALMYWNFRRDGPLFRLFQEFYLTNSDQERLLSYFLPILAIPILLVHVGAFFLKKWGDGRQTHWQWAGVLSLALWPGLLTAIGLCGAWYKFDWPNFYFPLICVFAPLYGLSLGNLVWRFMDLGFINSTLSEIDTKKYLRIAFGLTGLFIFFYVGWFSYLTVIRHWAFWTCIHDYSLYDQILWNTVNGRPWECGLFNSEFMGYHLHDFGNQFFAEHFIPTFGLAIPIYWLFPYQETVGIVQTIFLGLAALPVFLIALKKLRSPLLGFLFAALFLTHPIVQQTNIKDVHADAFGPIFLLAAMACYLYGYKVLYFGMLLLALGAKEEYSVNVAAMGLFIFFGEKDRKLGILTTVLGMAWYVSVVGFIIPWFRGGEPIRHMYRYSNLLPPGSYDSIHDITTGDVLKSMITNPVFVAKDVITWNRIFSFLMLLAPFGMFILWARWVWLWILPVAAIPLLIGWDYQHSLGGWYGIPIIAAATVGSIYGAARFLRAGLEPNQPLPVPRLAAGALALAIPFGFLWYEMGFWPGGQRHEPEYFQRRPHHDLAFKFFEEIPDDAIVSAQIELGAQIAYRRFIYMYPEIDDASYIMLDTRAGPWPLDPEGEVWRGGVRDLLTNGEWGLILPYEDGYLLFKRGHSTEYNQDALKNLNFEHYRENPLGI